MPSKRDGDSPGPMKRTILAVALCAATAAATLTPLGIAEAAGPAAKAWSIGPVIRGRNYSVGMPRNLEPGPDGPSFQFPYPTRDAGHVHAVTFPVGSLAGAKRIIAMTTPPPDAPAPSGPPATAPPPQLLAEIKQIKRGGVLLIGLVTAIVFLMVVKPAF